MVTIPLLFLKGALVIEKGQILKIVYPPLISYFSKFSLFFHGIRE